MRVITASRTQQLIVLVLMAALLARLAQVLLGLAVLSPLDTVDLLHDDAYYYLGIARSIASGEGSSFGGVVQTNGYQWLWQMILAAQSWLLDNDRHLLFSTTAVSGYLLTVIVAILCLRTLPANTSEFRKAMLTGLLLAGFAYREVFWHGMESTLFVVLFPWLIAIIEGRQTRPWLIALCFVLLPLARLDALALIGATYLVWFFRQRGRLSLQQLMPAGVVILSMAAYASFNQHYFDTPLPVSGLAKAVDSPRFANFGIIHYYINLSAGVALSVWLAVELWLRRVPTPTTFLSSIAVMAISALVQYGYYACFSGWPLWPWYLYLEAGLVMAVYARIFILLPQLLHQRPTLAIALLAGVLAFSLLGATRNVMIRPLLISATQILCSQHQLCLPELQRIRSYGAANLELLNSQRQLLHGKTIAMGDRAGSFGYWLPDDSKLLQTEGLVGNLTFLQARLAGTGEAFVANAGVDLFVVDRQKDTRITWQGLPIVALAEPVQGRVANRGAMFFCFPATAELSYRRSGAYSHQRIYDFHARIPCPSEAHTLLRATETGIFGLRRLAVSSEYGDGSSIMAQLEERDRRAMR
ncbi:MAG: hypothetical protein V4688_06035 [Pseudomonadota bacterium]